MSYDKTCQQCKSEYQSDYQDSKVCDKCRLKYKYGKLKKEMSDTADLFKGRYGEDIE